MNYLKININTDGKITEIGYVPTYEFPCPDFIAFDDVARWMCLDIPNMLDPNSWVLAPLEEDPFP